jgi:magnesium transporter
MLVNCVAYQNGRKLGDIRKEDISEYVKRPECFVWVALKDPEDAEIREMEEEFHLHELAVEDALHGHQRPKLEEYGDQLFAVLQIPSLRDGECVIGEVSVFVGPNFVLSIRRNAEPGFAAVRERAEREPELLRAGAGFVFYAILDNVVDRYFPLVDQLEVELEKVEGRIFSDQSSRTNAEQLYDLKHQVMVVRHAVEPLIEGVHKLYGGRVPQVCVGTQEYFRDVYDHLLRLSTQLDALRDMVITALSVNMSMISLAHSEVMKSLAAYAALVAVPTLIAGIYGMNFDRMPELKWQYGYPMAIGVMVVIDLLLLRRFRRIGWL